MLGTISGQNKAADLSSLLMIHSVATAFKSLLRPSDLISYDKGPAENLTAVITDVITDNTDNIDKVISHSGYFKNILPYILYFHLIPLLLLPRPSSINLNI